MKLSTALLASLCALSAVSANSFTIMDLKITDNRYIYGGSARITDAMSLPLWSDSIDGVTYDEVQTWFMNGSGSSAFNQYFGTGEVKSWTFQQNGGNTRLYFKSQPLYDENGNIPTDIKYDDCAMRGQWDSNCANGIAGWRTGSNGYELLKAGVNPWYSGSAEGNNDSVNDSVPDHAKAQCSSWSDNGDGTFSCTDNAGTVYTYRSGC